MSSILDKVKTTWIVTGAMTLIALVAMATGNPDIAYVSIGGLAGWIGGNKNGQRHDEPD
jgi:chromate transport protein ChrA